MSELWDLVWGKPSIDPHDLAAAIERELRSDDLDIRTRLLIRDGARALTGWGTRFSEATRARLAALEAEPLGPVKFPSIQERLMERTKPETIEQVLRELGSRVRHPVSVVMGGSASLILQGKLARATEDIDLVDEVPAEIRVEQALLDELRRRYGLALTHFQSHFLPSGWAARTHTIGAFGKVQVAIVDMLDVFLSKLFSARTKDLDDLRELLPQADRAALTRRLRDDCAGLIADAGLRGHAERNWYILTGDALPTG